MGKPRKSYSPEFKRQAVKTLLESGKTQKEVAGGLGINTNLLWQWKKLYQRELQHTEPPRVEPVSELSSSEEVVAVLKHRKAKLEARLHILEGELHMLEEVLRRYEEEGFK